MPTLNPVNRLRSSRWLLLAMLAALHGAMLLAPSGLLLAVHIALFLLWQGCRRLLYGALIASTAVAAIFWLDWWALAFWLASLFAVVGIRASGAREPGECLMHLSAMIYLCAALLLWVVPHLFYASAAIENGRILMCYVLPLLLCAPLLNLLRPMVFPVYNMPEVVETPLDRGISPKNSPSTEQRSSTWSGIGENDGVAWHPDFLYGLLLFMALALATLSCLAFMTLARLDYPAALLRTLLLAVSVWVALTILWQPNLRFSRIKFLISRPLLNAGSPLENGYARLAEAAQNETDPASYLASATRLLAEFPWLSGLSWQSRDGCGQLGKFSLHEVQAQHGELHLTLYARKSLNPALLQHIQQLSHLVGYFYQAKQREQSLRNIVRFQAIYETGSRLTHDLKNMLQSLLCISSLAQRRDQRAQQLLQQQLPMLAQRIESTLNKLRQPHSETHSETQPPPLLLSAWWDAMLLRNRHLNIDWQACEVLPNLKIPATLFDCALDNLLENALSKRQLQPDIRISVSLSAQPVNFKAGGWTPLATKMMDAAHPGQDMQQNLNPAKPETATPHTETGSKNMNLRLTVCDSGDPIPQAIACNLLRSVIASENGLGIGIYQVSRWAEQLGYRLSLCSNQAGRVCFELSGSALL